MAEAIIVDLDVPEMIPRTVSASEEEGERAPAGPLSRAAEEGIEHQEVSHVFHCMQCDLDFQVDLEVARNARSQEIDAGVVRVRLDPRIRLERAAQFSMSSD